MPSTTQDLELKVACSIRAGTAFPYPAYKNCCFYRTDLNELYMYDGANWVQWRTRDYTIVVAASNSLDPTLADPAYRCDGTDDQAEINNAITALGATGGAVILLDGTYGITASVKLASKVTLMGQGAGTVLRVPNGHDASLSVISGSSINHALVANLKIDGNKANQTAGVMHGIHFGTVTYSKVVDCWVEEMWTAGIYVYSLSNHNTVTGNTCKGNGNDGILLNGSTYNTMTENTCQGNGYNGIHSEGSSHNTVTGNTCQGNDHHGIYFETSSDNTIAGNTVVGNSQEADNTYDGIFIKSNCDYNNIQGNTVRHAGGAKQHKYGINISSADCDGNLVTNNDMYQSGRTANFNDAGTGTVAVNNRGAAEYPMPHAPTHQIGGADEIDSALNALAIALTTHGDIVYRAAAANTLAALVPGVAGQALLSGGPAADPYWGVAPPPGAHEATHVLGGTDVIDSALDARAIALINQGDIVYRAAAANTLAALAPGVVGQSLLTGGAGANPSWGAPAPAVHEPSHVDGGTDEIDSALDGRAITLTTQGDIVYASAANTLARLAAGTSGRFLMTQGAGANPTWADCARTILTTQGDILYRNAAGLARLGFGTAGQALLTQGVGANPIWGAPAPALHEATHVKGGADDIDAALDARALALANQGEIVYRAAAANTLAALGTGTAGQALLTGGAGANPSWGAPAPAAHATTHQIGGADDMNIPRAATLVVAASNSKDTTNADYYCDGTADQVEINAALTALPAGGGMVVLMEGTFVIDGQITIPKSNVALVGQGAGTVVKVKDGHNANIDLVSASTKDHLLIADLKLDGNKANQTAGDQRGVYWIAVTYSRVSGCWAENMRWEEGALEYGFGITLFSSNDHNVIAGCAAKDNDQLGICIDSGSSNTVTGNTCQGNDWNGIFLYSSPNNTVSGNTCQGNAEYGIYLSSSSDSNTVTGNTCQGNDHDGISLSSSSNNTVTGNACRGNFEHGISLYSSPNNTVTGNACQGNYEHGISLSSSSDSNTVSGNTCLGNSQETDITFDNIFLDASDYNLIVGNVCRRGVLPSKPRYGINVSNDTCDRNCLIGNDLYDSGSTGDLNDVPTTNPTLKHDNRDLAGTAWIAEV